MSRGRHCRLRGGVPAVHKVRGNTATPRRNIPTYDVLSEENLLRIEAAADRVLAETGIEFRDDPVALDHWRRAGAKVRRVAGEIRAGNAARDSEVRPCEFTQHARNPANSVQIGGKNVVFAPAYGSPFVMDLDRGRRFGTLEDFQNFIKLAQSSPNFHHSGGTICEPTDMPVNKRHLDMVMAHIAVRPALSWARSPPRSGPKTASTCAACCLARILSIRTALFWAM